MLRTRQSTITLFTSTLAGRRYRVATEQASVSQSIVQNNVGLLRQLTQTTLLTEPSTTPSITHPHQRRMEALKIAHKTTTRFSETYPESTIEDILKKILLSTNLPGERGVTSGIVQDDALQVKHRQPQCSSQTSSQSVDRQRRRRTSSWI
jgi:hypothetical protein